MPEGDRLNQVAEDGLKLHVSCKVCATLHNVALLQPPNTKNCFRLQSHAIPAPSRVEIPPVARIVYCRLTGSKSRTWSVKALLVLIPQKIKIWSFSGFSFVLNARLQLGKATEGCDQVFVAISKTQSAFVVAGHHFRIEGFAFAGKEVA